MVEIRDKHDCCGCSACVEACPKQCISFDEDEQGFRYPVVNKELCIDCRLCEKVCPVLNQYEPKKPLRVYAAINPDEDIRQQSSSGGIFTPIAETVISHNGVVFGARFNDKWEVIHDYTETIEGLDAFRGSKYVQSIIGDSYKKAEEFLKSGREVLFSGTPCQIAGLKRFLQKEYDNLLTIDVVCHGVPSPLVWRNYLKHVSSNTESCCESITDITFKDKSTGWKRYSFVIKSQSGKNETIVVKQLARENTYMKGFINNLTLRPVCFTCPFKNGKTNSDFTFADFWGIDRYCHTMNDDKGVSLVHINTTKADKTYQSITAKNKELNSNKIYNSSYSNRAALKYSPEAFWKLYESMGIESIESVSAQIRPSIRKRIGAQLRAIVKHILFRK